MPDDRSLRLLLAAILATKAEEATSALSRVEETALGYDRHFISDEAFDELLEFLREDSGYVPQETPSD